MNQLQALERSMSVGRWVGKAMGLVVTLCLVLMSFQGSAQDVVYIYGTVKDYYSSKKIDGVTVTVFKNGSKLMDVRTNASGKYDVNLDYGADYKLVYSKQGLVSKSIAMDTRNVPEEDRVGGHGFNLEMTLFNDIPGIDFSVLDQPIGKAKYYADKGEVAWDIAYTEKVRSEVNRLMKEYEDRKKREAGAEAEYAKQMQQGEAAMTAKDFTKAVAAFTAALAAKPDDAVATAKLSDAKMQKEGQDGDKQLEANYAALIKEADGLFNKKSYPEAKAKYDAASDLKDKEAYPKQRIREIESILAELAKKAEEERLAKELQEKYQAAITAADAAFKGEKWDDATAKYNDALKLKAGEKYPMDQLAAIVKKKEEAAKKAEEERLAKELAEKYQAAIAAGDAAFKAEKWDDATTKYNDALKLKAGEKYPTDQLAAIVKKKEEAAKKAEEERLAKELQEKYQAAITAADAAFKAEKWDDATARYNEALGLKSGEKYPKDQLAAIAKKKDDAARKAEEERLAKELQEKYLAAIAAADAAFAADKWDDATARYNEALGLKPGEKYPKDQLAAIQKKKDEKAKKEEEERKQREIDERYQAAIGAADQAFGKQDWEAARGKYNEAAAIKPAEKYPKDQLAAISKNIADAEARRKEEELAAKYQGLISDADAAFGKEDYALAKSKYLEASVLKPQERYPKDRILECDTKVAEKARLAEEERKRQELEARYTELITKADKAFGKEELSAALNDYKDALKLKPQEAHPKARIAAIEQKMDSAAQAKAEEERLERERKDREKRYADLVAAADKDFGSKAYDKAERGYRDALEIKPGEAHPEARLSDIARIRSEMAGAEEAARLAAEREAAERARKAEADRLAAEAAAAERARKAEADRLAAEAAAAEKARIEEEERMRRSSQAEQEARYKSLIAEGDGAFGGKDYEKARARFNSALGMKPGEQYPKDRLAAIDAAMAKEAADRDAADREAAERRRLEAERLRKEAEAAEAARLADMGAKQRAEEERRRKEAEEAEARRLAEERAKAEREGTKAIEERYRNAISEADEALAAKDYQRARGTYAQASDIKPSETYPKAKIDQIDRLLEEQERLRAEAELAAQRAAQARQPEKPRQSSTIDIRKEQEAEQFMRAAREREEAEKYERIKKFRTDLELQEDANASTAEQRRMEGVVQKARFQEDGARLYEGDESRRMQSAEELAAYRAALERSEAERAERAGRTRDESYQAKLAMQEEANAASRSLEERQADRAKAMADRVAAVQNSEAERAVASREQADRNRGELQEVAQRTMTMEERGRAQAEEKRKWVEEEKRAREVQERRLVQQSQESRSQAQERLASTPVDQPRSFSEHNRSKLAQDYPPGVTEESYTEGNKVIIRRVVVNGNRADEYSKVIAKWGTFYFKNGQSITEYIWSRETEG